MLTLPSFINHGFEMPMPFISCPDLTLNGGTPSEATRFIGCFPPIQTGANGSIHDIWFLPWHARKVRYENHHYYWSISPRSSCPLRGSRAHLARTGRGVFRTWAQGNCSVQRPSGPTTE